MNTILGNNYYHNVTWSIISLSKSSQQNSIFKSIALQITVRRENFEDQNFHEFHEQMTVCKIIICIILGVAGSQS